MPEQHLAAQRLHLPHERQPVHILPLQMLAIERLRLAHASVIRAHIRDAPHPLVRPPQQIHHRRQLAMRLLQLQQIVIQRQIPTQSRVGGPLQRLQPPQIGRLHAAQTAAARPDGARQRRRRTLISAQKRGMAAVAAAKILAQRGLIGLELGAETNRQALLRPEQRHTVIDGEMDLALGGVGAGVGADQRAEARKLPCGIESDEAVGVRPEPLRIDLAAELERFAAVVAVERQVVPLHLAGEHPHLDGREL